MMPFGSATPASPTQYSCSACVLICLGRRAADLAARYIWASCSDEWHASMLTDGIICTLILLLNCCSESGHSTNRSSVKKTRS